MRSKHAFIAIAASMLAAMLAAGPALADCSTEVALAVNSQGKQKFIRKETNMITESGPMKMVVEYQTPDRMRQVMTPLVEGKPVQSIVGGEKAWTDNGNGWKVAPAKVSVEFKCHNNVTYEGKTYLGYQTVPETVEGKTLARTILLDPETRRPAFNLIAAPDLSGVSLMSECYSYPTDIKIEKPL